MFEPKLGISLHRTVFSIWQLANASDQKPASNEDVFVMIKCKVKPKKIKRL